VLDASDLEKYYQGGLTDEFMEDFHSIRRFLPMVPSKGILGTDFNKILANRTGYKILVFPSTTMKVWKHKVEYRRIPKEFWVSLIDRLTKEGHIPVVINNYATYDLTKECGDKSVMFPEFDATKILAAMRATDCVLDVFSDISRYACIARTPYLSCIERSRYISEKDFELDDLCSEKLPRQYIFSFTTILEKGTEQQWNLNLFDSIVVRLNSFLPSLTIDDIPTGSEVDEEVSYKTVRVRKLKHLGVKFIKVPKE
jgi:hypothetical protein